MLLAPPEYSPFVILTYQTWIQIGGPWKCHLRVEPLEMDPPGMRGYDRPHDCSSLTVGITLDISGLHDITLLVYCLLPIIYFSKPF